MNSTKSKLLLTAGLFALVAGASGLTQRCSAETAKQDGPMFTGHPSTYDPALLEEYLESGLPGEMIAGETVSEGDPFQWIV